MCQIMTIANETPLQDAGSLTNLAKYPGKDLCSHLFFWQGDVLLMRRAASTIQILGAEKALFRALKTKSATPKYGILYQSSFIGRSGPKIKGRISRYLANKCSLACRIDNFYEHPTNRFGEIMRQQLEERLEFYATGAKPTKNIDAMSKAMKDILGDSADLDVDTEMIDHHAPKSEEAAPKVKKDKKEKKEKKDKDEKKEKKRKSIDAGADGEQKKKKKKAKLELDD
jgi:nucleolar protein 56